MHLHDSIIDRKCRCSLWWMKNKSSFKKMLKRVTNYTLAAVDVPVWPARVKSMCGKHTMCSWQGNVNCIGCSVMNPKIWVWSLGTYITSCFILSHSLPVCHTHHTLCVVLDDRTILGVDVQFILLQVPAQVTKGTRAGPEIAWEIEVRHLLLLAEPIIWHHLDLKWRGNAVLDI